MGRLAILALTVVPLAALGAPARAGEAVPPAVPSGAALRVAVPAAPDADAGFDRSLFAEAAREAGLGVVFDVTATEAALAALDAGRVDVAAGPFPPARASEPWAGRRALASAAPGGDALLKRRGDGSLKAPEDAAGKAVGLLATASAVPRLRAEAAALGARVAESPRAFADPLGALATGRLAALIGGLPEVAAAALARPDAFEVVGPVPVRGRLPAALVALVRADRAGLAARLDAALGRMRADGRLAAVQRRWFGVALGAPSPTGSQPVATVKP